MGEGKSDRSSKRQRSSHAANKSSSDTELAQGKGKGKKSKSKEKWPLLEGLTVDELARYRRRRVHGQPRDNLRLYPELEDKALVSEYRETFRANEDSIKENIELEKSKQTEDSQPEDLTEREQPSNEEEPKEQDTKDTEFSVTDKESVTPSIPLDDDKTMETEVTSKFANYANPKRPSLIRRGTTLKRDGEFYTDTETYSSYVAYEGQHRPELARRPTSLKMEGDLDTTTEKCEKFIQWLNVSRPELTRVPTHLKLEGEIETVTENHAKYVPFVGVRRPTLLRQNTHLKLEGKSNFVPEYADVFKRHNSRERPQPVKPETHLRTGKDFFLNTENTDNFVNPSLNEAQLMNELNRDVEEEEIRQKEQREKKKEEEMKMLVSKLEDLKGPPLGIPEYKDAYKDFPRGRPTIAKPEDEIGRADGSKISSSPTNKFLKKIDQDPEYKSKYMDYQKDHPVYRKPPLAVRSSMFPPEHNAGFEGNLNLEPEYRTAYCTKRESQLHTEPRMHRRRDRSLSDGRRKENYWMNNNEEQFNCVNAAQGQNAFQVLNTKIHEDTVCGRPPSGSRRGSKISQIQVQRPIHVDVVERNALKDELLSPTYRLHVCNVDDEPQGFRRRRSPSLQSSGRIRNPSPDRALQSDDVRPYSPSFGKTIKQHNNGQSFVVLDNEILDRNRNEVRRRRADRNYNIDELSHSKGRTRITTNWMPPWYDSTNTI
ncbi:uncharacterized protein LOC143186840 isoform X2 [Calliopsis andreniformis]|uniref:uncharacterized protein LOC143186840 isoform X2 n=1 Tax=Calliopsis andreniformis TaxID=337506 RepID=UPI003FCE6FA9